MERKSKFDTSFKTKVALETIKEQKILTELAREFGVSSAKTTA
jgi:transposase-like protein